jgi:hypothetical protein
MNDLLNHINEYFNTFNNKDYTIYVDGNPTEWCKVNSYAERVVWNIPSSNNDYNVYGCEIELIRFTPTTLEIVKTNGKEYKFVAKRKTKEEKAKKLILKAKNALNVHLINDAMDYLNELEALMDE